MTVHTTHHQSDDDHHGEDESPHRGTRAHQDRDTTRGSDPRSGFRRSGHRPAAPGYLGDQPTVGSGDGFSCGARSILAVDDEPALGRMLARMLGYVGHVVTVVSSAEAAIDLLDTSDFDVVVSDVHLGGGLSGWQLAEHARRRRPHVRVCLVTSWGVPDDPSEAADRGVAAMLGKPYRLRDLLAAVAPT